MSDSESDDAELRAEEERIRAEYGLANAEEGQDEDGDEDDHLHEYSDGGGENDGGADADLAAAAVADQIQRLEGESQRLQEERDLLKEQVGNFEDLLLAMQPADGVDPNKFMETIMVNGVEVCYAGWVCLGCYLFHGHVVRGQ